MTAAAKQHIDEHPWFYKLLSSTLGALLIWIAAWTANRVVAQGDDVGKDVKRLLPLIEQMQVVQKDVVEQRESLRRNGEAVMALSIKVSELKGYSEGANSKLREDKK